MTSLYLISKVVTFRYRSFLRWNSSRFTAKIYYRSKLASHFRISSELLPLFAFLAGNDYVSAKALMDVKSALGRVQNDKRVGKRVKTFTKIAGLLRGLPQLVFSRRSTEIHA